MSKETDYLGAEVARAQSEGAESVVVRIPEMHSILARLAELERYKAENKKGRPVRAGYVNLEELENMRAGESFFCRIARASRSKIKQPVFYYPEIQTAADPEA